MMHVHQARPFTPALQAFFNEMQSWPWRTELGMALFIRDFHELPVSSPHDIDLMMDNDLQGAFIARVRGQAAALGLHCVARRGPDVCFVLLCDLDLASEGRAWAYLEVREKIHVTPSLTLSAKDIDVVVDDATGLPVPSTPWQAFMIIIQGVRTGRIEKSTFNLQATGINANDARELFKSKLDLDVYFEGALKECQNALGIIEAVVPRVPGKADSRTAISIPARISELLRRNLFFFSGSSALFFTIHGPDGVGKTTTCAEITKIFGRLPIPFSSFHHITGWKRRKEPEKQASTPVQNAITGSQEQGGLRRFVRTVYRLLPKPVQKAYVLAAGYVLYLRSLNKLVGEPDQSARVTLVDRYIYDIATKSLIRGEGYRWIHRLFVRLAQRPVRAFILNDLPEAIRARKQELTMGEITAYRSVIIALAKAHGVRVDEVEVTGRTPNAVAQVIATKVLDDCSHALLALLRAGKQAIDDPKRV